MTCAVLLSRKGYSVTVLERGERLGRKLAATGNGQGNVTNTDMNASHYFSDDGEKVERLLSRFGYRDTVRFLESMGGIFPRSARESVSGGEAGFRRRRSVPFRAGMLRGRNVFENASEENRI